MGRWSLLLVALGACVNIPKFQGGDKIDAPTGGDGGPSIDAPPRPPGDLSVYATADADGGVTVDGGFYRLHFASTGAHFPDSLILDGQEMIGHASCPYEDGIGIGGWPSMTTATAGTGTIAIGDIGDTMKGPAVVKVALDWSAPFCGGMLSGTSTFTITPNGQIVRSDVLDASSNTAPGSCACGGLTAEGQYYVTTFAAFKKAPFSALVVSTGSKPVGSNQDSWGYYGCLENPMRRIAAAFDNSGPGTYTDVVGQNIAFAQNYVVRDTLNDHIDHVSTYQLGLGNRTCLELGQHADAQSAMIQLNTDFTSTGNDRDAIYRIGPMPHQHHLTAETTTIPSGMTVGFQLDNIGMPTITRNPAATGDWYIAQPNGDGWIVWFRDPVSSTTTITIVAP